MDISFELMIFCTIGMTRLMGEQETPLDLLMDDIPPEKTGRIAEGAQFYFGSPADLPWTLRIVEMPENIPEGSAVELDLEICRVPWFGSLYGIRFKRRSGDRWRFQELCQTLIRKVKL